MRVAKMFLIKVIVTGEESHAARLDEERNNLVVLYAFSRLLITDLTKGNPGISKQNALTCRDIW